MEDEPRLCGHHALEAGHVALLGGDLEVAVDDTASTVSVSRSRLCDLEELT